MSKRIGKLAQRYARALYRALVEEGQGGEEQAQQLANSINAFAKLWEEQRELRVAALNPMFQKAQRLEALLKLAQMLEQPDIAQRFLRMVFDRDRIALIPEIAAAFAKQAGDAASIVPVEITVAREVGGEHSKSIESGLEQQIAGKLTFEWKVDPSILGGMLVRYQGKVLDGSLSGRLERIEKRMMA